MAFLELCSRRSSILSHFDPLAERWESMGLPLAELHQMRDLAKIEDFEIEWSIRNAIRLGITPTVERVAADVHYVKRIAVRVR